MVRRPEIPAQSPFAGRWVTSYGPLRIAAHGARLRGTYRYGSGDGRIEGTQRGDVLTFGFREQTASGSGRFTLSTDRSTFSGEWRARGKREWQAWNGHRVLPEEGLTWLVVLEAHWQRSLAEPEYSYGSMLREVFARLPQVRLRHRFFHDAASLGHWCGELQYLAEPLIVLIASHGLAEGLSVHGKLIDTTHVLDSLNEVDELKLLHFSSCLVGLDGRLAVARKRWPVSGYSTSVDWGASALLEFTYLDLILGRGMSPAQAARMLPKLVSYAGSRARGGSPYRAAGFRFFPPMDSR